VQLKSHADPDTAVEVGIAVAATSPPAASVAAIVRVFKLAACATTDALVVAGLEVMVQAVLAAKAAVATV